MRPLPAVAPQEVATGTPITRSTPATGTSDRVASTETLTASALGAIQGTVTDDGSGAPLAGVTVTAWSWDSDVRNSALTDASGGYTILGMPDGTYQVSFDDYATAHIGEIYNNVPRAWIDDGHPVTVTGASTVTGIDAALAQGSAIEGRVVNAAGEPIADVCVYVWSTESDDSGQVCTGVDGHYRTTGVAAGTYNVEFNANDTPYLSAYYGGGAYPGTPVTTVLGQDTLGIDATLARGATIAGTVTDNATGAPLEGVWVTASTGDDSTSVRTDAEGHYRTGGLRTGEALVSFWDPSGRGYLEAVYTLPSTAPEPTPVAVVVGQDVTGIDIGLQLGGSISGRITGTTGEPVVGACVRISISGDEWSPWFGCTDASGDYRVVGLDTGDFAAQVEGMDSGYLDAWYLDKPDRESATPIPVTVGQETSAVNQTLQRGATITGVLTEAVSGDPAHGVCVTAWGSSQTRTGCTDATGRYTINGLPAGDYKVGAEDRWGGSGSSRYQTWWYDGKADATEADALTVELGQAYTIDASLKLTGSISGRVTLSTTGEPAKAIVIAYDATSDFVASGGVEPDGTYTVWGLTTGAYRLQFYPQLNDGFVPTWYESKPSLASADPVNVVIEQNTPGIDQALALGGRLSIAVTDAAGEPVPWAEAYVLDGDGTTVTSTYLPEGTGGLDLWPETYRVRVEAYGYAAGYFDGAATLETATGVLVTEGQTNNITVVLQSWGTVSGRVTDEAEQPLSAEVTLHPASDLDRITASTTTDPEGHYTFKAPAGQYVVRFKEAGAEPTHVSTLR